MKQLIRLVIGVFLASAALFLAGCSHTQKTQESQMKQEAPKGFQYSGFLGDYSMLSETMDARGERIMRYVNPKIHAGAYQAIMLEPTQFYPQPQPTKQVDANTLANIRQYMDTSLQAKLGEKITLVSKPGPGVLRIRPAITAVSGDKASLKPYQYIPFAFVITEAKGRKRTAALQVEVDVTDSLSGERMGAAVRSGEGTQLEGRNAKLTLDDVRPLLDKWTDTGATFVGQFVR